MLPMLGLQWKLAAQEETPAPLRQGARHAQLRRPACGPAPGTHGGAFAANGGASLKSRFQFRVRKAADLSNENCDRTMTMVGRLSDGLRMMSDYAPTLYGAGAHNSRLRAISTAVLTASSRLSV